MDPNSYRFRSEWQLNAPTDDVFRALAEIDDYPTWWPEVRAVHRLSDDTRRLIVRSLLPYDLAFTVYQSQRDRHAGVLEATLDGDLEGFSRWTITASSSGALAVFEEEVIARKSLLRLLALVGRPAFIANHWLMMRHGQLGIAAYLAGMRLGRESTTP